MTTPTSVTIVADECYFGLLDAPSSGAGRAGQEALMSAFEEILPVPAEHVHAVFVPLLNGRFVGCGVRREVAQQYMESGATRLSPDHIPEFVARGEPLDPASINLLSPPFAPKVLVTLHRRTTSLAAIALLVLTALLVTGLERRRASERREIKEMRLQTTQLLERVLSQPTSDTKNAQSAALRFTAELRRLRGAAAIADASIGMKGSPEASLSLQELLRAWPAAIASRTDRVSITPDGISVSTTVPSNEDARAFASILDHVPGWRLLQPQTTTMRDGTRVRLQFARMISEPLERKP